MNSQLTELARATGADLRPDLTSPVHEVTLIEILTQLALRKSLIAAVTGVAVLAGVVLAFTLPVRYAAISRIMPPQQTQSSAGMLMSQLANSGSLSVAALAGSGLGLKNPNDIYIGLLNSRPVADDIIKKFNLAAIYRSRDMTAARKKLAGFTSVASEKSGMIAITVTDRDRKRVAEITNAYVDELRDLTRHLAVTEAGQRRLFYEDQLHEAKDALVTAETAFQQIQQNKGLVALDAQAKAMIEGMADLRARAAAKQIELQALKSYSTERNPQVEIAERELASIQDEIARMEQRSQSSRSSALGLGDVPSAGMDYLRAEHEVKYRQAMFDLLLRQYDAAKLDESKEAAIIQVVEPAIQPDRRSSPQRTLMIVGFAGAGFFFACMLALILRWLEVMRSDPGSAARFEALGSALRKGKQGTPSWP